MIKREGYLERGAVRLYYELLLPEDGRSKALVAIVHGVGEHLGRHLRLGECLAGAGYAALLHDLRGAGRSDGLRGHVDRFADYTADLAAVIDAAGVRGETFVLGHSLGGVIAAAFALSHPDRLKGLILSSPGLRPKVKTPYWKTHLARDLSMIAPRLRMSSGLPLEKLAHDPAVARDYAADPLCFGKVSARWYVEFIRMAAKLRKRASDVNMPTLVLQGGGDEVVDPEATREFFSHLGAIDKRLVFFEGAYHEVFNDDCQEAARAEVIAWLDAHAQSLESGILPTISG